MKIGILGTGVVGLAIASKLVQQGTHVIIGSRDANNEKAQNRAKLNGDKASHGSFADAASFGEIIFNCTAGSASLDALRLAGAGNLNGKILIDVENPPDFSKGMPPTFTICNDESPGERIQKEFPDTKVVKALNTINYNVMTNPDHIPADHDLLISGNDADTKKTVSDFLKERFGWKSIIDLGNITNARGTEMYAALWVRLFGALQTPIFNIKVVM